jgi:hypothetical protein
VVGVFEALTYTPAVALMKVRGQYVTLYDCLQDILDYEFMSLQDIGRIERIAELLYEIYQVVFHS